MTIRRACMILLLAVVTLPVAFSQTLAERDADQPSGDVRADVPGKSVPRLVKFSGVLRDGAGRALAGKHAVTFALYAEQASASALWSETQVVTADEQGRYTVMLGAAQKSGIPNTMFASGEARWLETKAATDEGAPAQRLMLVSVPFALKAEDADKLGGRSASDFVMTSEVEQYVAKAVAEAKSQAFYSPDPPILATVQDIAPNGAARFSDTSAVEVVIIQQNGSGFGLNAVSITGSAIRAQSLGVGSGNATILGQATATSGSPVAVQGESSGPTGIGVQGIAISPAATSNVGVRGEAAGSAGRGVAGLATHSSGPTVGVLGAVTSNAGTGVRGEAPSGIGAAGVATATSGNGVGVLGEVSSAGGTAGLFRSNNSAGKVIVGQGAGATDVFTLDANGNVTLSGVLTAVGGLTTSGTLNVNSVLVPSSSSSSGLVKATNSGTGPAVEGLAAGANNAGVYGRSISGTGVGVLGESNSASGTAGMFNNTAGGKIISGQSNGTEVFNVKSPSNAVNSAVLTAIQSGSNVAEPTLSALPPTAVLGQSTAGSGFTAGVMGLVNSPDGVALVGISTSTVSGSGVAGITNSVNGDSAVSAESLATTGNAKALSASVNSPAGTVLELDAIASSATLIRGEIGPEGSGVEVFKVDGSGTVTGLAGVFTGDNGGVIGRDTINDAAPRVGVQGLADSNNGRGVVGNVPTTGAGSSIGVLGVANADNSAGVLGRATSATGTTSGVRGINFSSGGHAVRGDNYPPTANAVVTNGIGVLGTYGQNANFTTNTSATGGFGVLGRNFATNGYGVSGEASADGGVGVEGVASGPNNGRAVRGNLFSLAGFGVEGVAQNASGTGIGVNGVTNANNGVGVRAEATSAGGTSRALEAINNGPATVANLVSLGSGPILTGSNIGGQVFSVGNSGAVTAAGIIHSTSGGIRFPDNTVQTTAAGAGSGVSTNTPNTLVQRDGAGSFATQNVNLDGMVTFTATSSETLLTAGLQRISGINPNETVLWFGDALRIKSGSTGTAGDRVSVLSNGNVGIGTNAPAVRLHVGGGAITQARMESTNPAGAALEFKPTSGGAGVDWFVQATGPGAGQGNNKLVFGSTSFIAPGVLTLDGTNGNASVAGTITAAAFSGDGSGLTNISASNATSLGGVAAANYARTDISNSFSGNQTITGINVGAALTVNGAANPGTVLQLDNTSGGPLLKGFTGGTPKITIDGAGNIDTQGFFHGFANGVGNAAVLGIHNGTSSTGANYGVFGRATDNTGTGVHGENITASGAGVAGVGNPGVVGTSPSAIGSAGIFNNIGGGNILLGQQNGTNVFTVNNSGVVSATSFSGDGSGLTNVAAASATNATSLGGVAAANYARNDQVNTFGANQVINANTATPTAGLDITQAGTGSALNVAAAGVGAFPNGAVITATATDTAGVTQSRAVLALANAPGGRGIQAVSQATTGGGIGVIGFSAGDAGLGLSGLATSLTGATRGVRGWAASPTGTAGEFEVEDTGAVILRGIGVGLERFSVTGGGNVTATGTVTATAFAGDGSGLTGVSTTAGSNTFTADQTFSANIDLATTSSISAGVIEQNGVSFIHSFGTNNTFVGKSSGNFSMTGTGNVALGQFALFSSTSGSFNTAVGADALSSNTTGAQNTALGNGAMPNSTTGNANVAVGTSALATNTTGGGNVAVGAAALFFNSASNSNVAMGEQALFNTTGAQNTAVGASTGLTNTTGTQNTFVGYNANAGAAGLSNATAIGANATVSASNALILGNNADVGIGTSTPSAKLDVVGTVKVGGGTPLAKYMSATGSISVTLGANSCDATQTVTVTGAAQGDSVAIGVDGSLGAANLIYMGFVSSPNTVTIRSCNSTGGSVSATGTLRVSVFQH